MKRAAFLTLFIANVFLAAPALAETPLSAIPSKKASRSLLLDVASAGKRLVAVGERGHIVLSDDVGKTWRQAASPTRSLLAAVYFVDEKRGWAVGHDSVILATADAGDSWVLQHYQEYGAATEAPVPVAGEGVADENYDETFVEDEGRGVVSREGVPLLDVWFADTESGVAVGAYGLMLRTKDGGKSWQDVSDSIGNPDGWHLNAVAGLRGERNVVLVAGEKGTLYRSLDRGESFTASKSPYGGSFFGAAVASDGAFYVFGLQGSLFRSTDKGVAWTRLDTGISSGLNDACETGDGRLLIAGNAGVVLSAQVGATTFTAERRSDRQSVLSCAVTGNAVVLVGEGGVKFPAVPARNP